METETVREFFMGLAGGAGMNLHIRQLAGENTHHIVEAMFKAVAKSIDMAVSVDPRIDGVLTTKGVL
jgi:imidazoleglycerol-phosphate dehydratase